MANGINSPFGLRAIGHTIGKADNSVVKTFKINPAAGSIFAGDLVLLNTVLAAGGGTIVRYAYNTDGGAGDNASTITGVLDNVTYRDINNNVVNALGWLAGTNIYPNSVIEAQVIIDPYVEYEVQGSAWTNVLNDATIAKKRVGQNFGVGLGGGGNIVTNPAEGTLLNGSAMYLAKVFTANPPANTVITLPLKLVGFSALQGVDKQDDATETTAVTSPYLNCRVIINNHFIKPGTLGIVAA